MKKLTIGNFEITISTKNEANELMDLENIKKHLDLLGYRIVKKTTDNSKKILSATKANKIKSDNTKKKIENTINLLRMEKPTKKITLNKIKELSEVSFTSVKKYVKQETLDELNKGL